VKAAAALAVTMLASSLAAGCSFERRSPAYACEIEAHCDPGRTCQQGWCVEIASDGGPGIDADPNAPDATDAAASCSADVCTRCDVEGRCIIACDGAGSCPDQVVCPAGLPCKVECNGEGSCMGGIDCSAARRCDIECTNTSACAGLLSCPAGTCNVECGGIDSCAGGIDCSGSCACRTLCTGSGSCATPPSCPAQLPAQCTSGIECVYGQGPGGCSTC
jgi:hypothetical protein